MKTKKITLNGDYSIKQLENIIKKNKKITYDILLDTQTKDMWLYNSGKKYKMYLCDTYKTDTLGVIRNILKGIAIYFDFWEPNPKKDNTKKYIIQIDLVNQKINVCENYSFGDGFGVVFNRKPTNQEFNLIKKAIRLFLTKEDE